MCRGEFIISPAQLISFIDELWYFLSYLLRHTVVVDLQCIFLLVIVWRDNDPNNNDNLT